MSFVSLYNPSAGKNGGNKAGNVGDNTAKNRWAEPETNSNNSQTHTEQDKEAEVNELVRQGMSREWAEREVYRDDA